MKPFNFSFDNSWFDLKAIQHIGEVSEVRHSDLGARVEFRMEVRVAFSNTPVVIRFEEWESTLRVYPDKKALWEKKIATLRASREALTAAWRQLSS
jgi:hypothetical protein